MTKNDYKRVFKAFGVIPRTFGSPCIRTPDVSPPTLQSWGGGGRSWRRQCQRALGGRGGCERGRLQPTIHSKEKVINLFFSRKKCFKPQYFCLSWPQAWHLSPLVSKGYPTMNIQVFLLVFGLFLNVFSKKTNLVRLDPRLHRPRRQRGAQRRRPRLPPPRPEPRVQEGAQLRHCQQVNSRKQHIKLV